MPYKDTEKAKASAKARYERNLEVRKAKMRADYQSKKSEYIARAKEYVASHKEETKEYQATWRSENKEIIKQYKLQYYQEHREELIFKSVKYRQENIEIRDSILKRYYATPKGKLAKQSNRNARRKRERHASLGRVFHKEIMKIYLECKKVTEITGNLHEVDHIIPLAGKNISGLHVPWNLQILPHKENRKKSNKIIM